MHAFLVLMGELLLIICIQSVFEVLAAGKKQPYMQKMIMVACYLGSMYIVLQFAYNYLFKELATIFNSIL